MTFWKNILWIASSARVFYWNHSIFKITIAFTFVCSVAKGCLLSTKMMASSIIIIGIAAICQHRQMWLVCMRAAALHEAGQFWSSFQHHKTMFVSQANGKSLQNGICDICQKVGKTYMSKWSLCDFDFNRKTSVYRRRPWNEDIIDRKPACTTANGHSMR